MLGFTGCTVTPPTTESAVVDTGVAVAVVVVVATVIELEGTDTDALEIEAEASGGNALGLGCPCSDDEAVGDGPDTVTNEVVIVVAVVKTTVVSDSGGVCVCCASELWVSDAASPEVVVMALIAEISVEAIVKTFDCTIAVTVSATGAELVAADEVASTDWVRVVKPAVGPEKVAD